MELNTLSLRLLNLPIFLSLLVLTLMLTYGSRLGRSFFEGVLLLEAAERRLGGQLVKESEPVSTALDDVVYISDFPESRASSID